MMMIPLDDESGNAIARFWFIIIITSPVVAYNDINNDNDDNNDINNDNDNTYILIENFLFILIGHLLRFFIYNDFL
jgi:hypothetical protein